MPLASSYQEFILENIIKGYLYKSEIPTSDMLEEDLKKYKLLHKDLSLPRSKYSNFSIEKGSSSSASLLNEISDILSDDIVIVTREIYKLAKENSLYYERWLIELERLLLRAKKLEDKSDGLLLLSGNTAGYFASVSDIFTDMNLIDTENTTALVNVSEQLLTLNNGTEHSGSVTQIDTTKMTESQVSFAPLTKRPGTTSFDVGSENSLVQIFRTEETSWVSKIVTIEQGAMTAELKINLGSDFEVSKIAIESATPSTNTRTTITAQYSVDGYTWYIVPTNQATLPLNGNVSWYFPVQYMRWVKFIIHKTSSDQGQYEYLYGLKSIKFFSDNFFSDSGNLFYSLPLSAVNTSNETVFFSKVQLDACENIPNNTTINYSLSASKDGTNWSSWYPILPSSREEINYPKVVNFGGIDWKNNQENGTALNPSYDTDVLVSEFTESTVDQYRFKKSTYAAVNVAIPISTGEDPNLISNSIVVWRNTRDTEFSTVRGVLRGWNLDGQVYSCYFEVSNPGGRLFDFGDKECVVDGKIVSGIVEVSEGIHKFQTSAENWFDISDSVTESVITEESLATIDPLYPYNHLLIIEGFSYPDIFDGEKVYVGSDMSAEFYSVRTSLFSIENNDLDYGHYSVHNIGMTDNILSVIVKYNPNNIDYINEKFIVKWKSGDSEASMYKYIKLQAELDSEDALLTPSLSSYRIKLGV